MAKTGELPKSMVDEFRGRFEMTPEVRQMRTRVQYFKSTGKFAEAMELEKTLEELFIVALHGYMERAEKQARSFKIETKDFSEKDNDDMMEKLMVLFMCCDIIESSVMDLNDALHRTRPDVNITTFDDVRQALSAAKMKLKYLQDKGDYMNDLVWGDSCDNMYEMMQSKARSIIRKRRESNNWGDNMKKFDK